VAKADPTALHIDKSEAKQAEREALIQDAINRGIFTKTKDGNFPQVWVAADFLRASTDQKKTLFEVVYSYYRNGNEALDEIQLTHAQSGKQVGSFSRRTGLQMN
jgi:hypothetical protein